ncbi:MAG: M48 family metallopeptidase [Novosphingobium sp.]|nr:M48 family metallopeptidase [Novosphingobium sp.]
MSTIFLRRILAARVIAAILAGLGGLPAVVHAEEAPWPVRLRQDMARVQQVEWRLRQAADGLCPRTAADIGVALDDRRAYARTDWPLLAQVLGMADRPVVAALTPDGPAAQAGILPGDAIEAIAGEPVEVIIARRRPGPLVADALLEEIAATPPGDPLALSVRRGSITKDIFVIPARHCAARLVLETDRSVDAHSDARNVSISTGLVTLARNDDELAMAAAHELAHIIHGDHKGGGIGKRRRMEDAADSLGLQLLHCARYDAARGIGLFERLRARDWLGFLSAPTHRSFAKRLERLDSEIPSLACPPRPNPAQ